MTPRPSPVSRFVAAPLFFVFLLAATTFAATPTEKVLHNFQGTPDGADPTSRLVADSQGHLYGTTPNGGTGTNCGNYSGIPGCGTVFELTPPSASGGSWTEKVLYSFQGGNDGAVPVGGLILDRDGNLYGTTSAGGDSTGADCVSSSLPGCGTVFRLSPPQASSASWTESLLYVFQGGSDGSQPQSGLIFDGKGDLYGTTYLGGSGYCDGYGAGCGSVFELATPLKESDPWTKSILYNFNGLGGAYYDGAGPWGGVVFDSKGNLYGTTSAGGASRCYSSESDCGGIVFQLARPTAKGLPWTENIIYEFGSNAYGSYPMSTLVFDKNGNLYGTTEIGGSGGCTDESDFPEGCGTVFELSPPASGTAWNISILYSFTGQNDGAIPLSGVVFDEKGSLYGTAVTGGGQGDCFWKGVPELGCGTAFRITPPATAGGVWDETTLHAFAGGSDGANPSGGVIYKSGNLFGTTTGYSSTLAASPGTVFAIRP
jgi:hypothetical protein